MRSGVRRVKTHRSVREARAWYLSVVIIHLSFPGSCVHRLFPLLSLHSNRHLPHLPCCIIPPKLPFRVFVPRLPLHRHRRCYLSCCSGSLRLLSSAQRATRHCACPRASPLQSSRPIHIAGLTRRVSLSCSGLSPRSTSFASLALRWKHSGEQKGGAGVRWRWRNGASGVARSEAERIRRGGGYPFHLTCYGLPILERERLRN